MFAVVRKPAGLLAVIAALAVLSAGCIVQDRPHEGEFNVVADAGQSQVIAVGDTAHFEWGEDHALKAEGGEPPHVNVTYSWKVGEVEASVNHSVAVARAQPEFVLVELNVTAKEHTASDSVGVLVVPPAADTSRQLYVAAVGPIKIWPMGSFAEHNFVSGAHSGHWATQSLPPGAGRIDALIRLPEDEFPLEPVRASILLAVKDGAGAARGVATGPLEFDPGFRYTLSIDPSPAAHHMISIRDAEGAVLQDMTLEAFEAAHPAEEAVEVPVVDAQTLPGFEGLAAVATMVVLGAVLVAARRRL